MNPIAPLRADASAVAAMPGRSGRRWLLPASLLLAEYLLLSVLVDFPVAGPAIAVIGVARLVLPVVVGAAAAGCLLARHPLEPGPAVADPPQPWGPWPALFAHLVAFLITALGAWRLFGPGSPVVSLAPFLAWLAGALLTALLAVWIAAPPGWTLRRLSTHWRGPVLALTLGLLSWRAAAAAEGLWGALSSGTLHAVAWLLGLVSPDVFVDVGERVVGVDGFDVRVAPVCSGVDGIGLVLLFQAIWISMGRSRIRTARALLLLPLGLVAALSANVLRIATLLLVGAAGREELAMGGLHSKLGWLLFLGIALGSVALAERTPWLARSGAAAVATGSGVPAEAAAYVAPLLAAIAAALVAGVFGAGFDRWYAARIACAAAVLALVRRSLPRFELSRSFVPVLAGLGVGVLWISLAGGGGTGLVEGLARLGPWERWGWLGLRLLGSCLVIPVIEELAFRGFLLPWLVRPDFERVPPGAWSWPALLLSSLAFGALHDRWLIGTAAGLVFAAVRLHRGRVGDAILAHSIANAGVAAAVLLGGRWDLWGSP